MQDSNAAVMSKSAGLVDLLDRTLSKGVVVDGDIQLCVAGIDLVYLKLKLLLASTATVEQFEPSCGDISDPCASGSHCGYNPLPKEKNVVQRYDNRQIKEEGLTARILDNDEPAPCFDRQKDKGIDIDPKKVEQGLAKLILTLVEVIRKLMEKQALRRVENGKLTDKQIDQLGEAFMRLEEKMKELKKLFNLKDSDLNLDLGPIGDLT